MGMEFFFKGGGGGVVDPYKMTLIVNRWQTGSVGLSYMYEYLEAYFFVGKMQCYVL